jgi:hypothetical protein
LYGDRLKLFYLVDQGIKMENNNLRFHEQEKQQKKYRATDFKAACDMAKNKKKAVEGGRQYILPSSFTHGKRCYSQRYYDGISPYIINYQHVYFVSNGSMFGDPETRFGTT